MKIICRFRPLLIIGVLFIILVAPAQATSLTYPQANSSVITMLLTQLAVLQEQLAELLAQSPSGRSGMTYMPPVSRPLIPSTVDTDTQPTLESFSIATTPWSSKIKPTGIPSNAYKAYYFNTNAPSTIISTSVVPSVAISYAWSDMDIESEDFGGFWIGRITVPTDGNYLVSTAESWSESRVIINQRLVKTQKDDAVSLYLKKGIYTVEVEFVNNSHTTDFSMNLMPAVKQWDRAELANELKRVASGAVNTYVGVYESAAQNRDVIVDLTKSTQTGILFLASYSQVNWVLKNPHLVKAVVIGSYDKGVQLRGVPTGVPVYYTNYEVLSSEYSLEANCATYEDYMDACDYIDQLSKVDAEVMTLTGKKINNFTGEYAANTLVVPGMVITDAVRTRILNSYATTKATAAQKLQKNTIEGVFR